MPQTVRELSPRPLTAAEFKAFGDVIEVSAAHQPLMINNGLCQRHHDLATLSFAAADEIGVSLFRTRPSTFPLLLTHMERHPLASQTFIPMSADPYLVIVAADDKGQPQIPEVFVTNGQQAVNYHRNTWHATLTTVVADGLFAVVDYIGEAGNLQESPLDPGCLINYESSPG